MRLPVPTLTRAVALSRLLDGPAHIPQAERHAALAGAPLPRVVHKAPPRPRTPLRPRIRTG